MMLRFCLSIGLVAILVTNVNAQSGQQNVAPQPVQQPQGIVMPGQPTPNQAVQQPQNGQPVLMPNGQYYQNGQQLNYNPILGSGLPGAQKDGCNCFQMPPLNMPEPYNPYASKNYWDLCPPCTQGYQRPACSQPAFDFNYFIPRPTGARLFRR